MSTARLVTVIGALLLGTAGGDFAVAAAPDPDPPTPFVHASDVHTSECVIVIQPGDSLSIIAEAMPDTAVSYRDLQEENGIGDADSIEAGGYLDICVGNRVDDVTGESRSDEPEVLDSAVATQQRQLNEVFGGSGMPELAVDGVSGPLTKRHLCAFRVAFGLPVNRSDMEPGSSEEQMLMSADSLPRQEGAPRRWALIDKTCQVMFAGDDSNIVFVFPTSTGEPGFETRDQSGSRAFRYDPATENDGWHDSTHFPAAADNPLNGNMYKPVYFDDGQAIHGSFNVPPEPASKGCARLMVEHQDMLLDWLGLGDVTNPVWDSGDIDLSVIVQGEFVPA